jgi:hypothetical protein
MPFVSRRTIQRRQRVLARGTVGAQPYVDGTTWRARLARESRLPAEAAIRIAAEVAEVRTLLAG